MITEQIIFPDGSVGYQQTGESTRNTIIKNKQEPVQSQVVSLDEAELQRCMERPGHAVQDKHGHFRVHGEGGSIDHSIKR